MGHVQGAVGTNAGSVTTFTVVLPVNPTQGNLVCVGATFQSASNISGLTVKDGNNNSYTVTPGSPSANIAGTGYTYLAYLLSAPANADKTLTLSWTTASTGPRAWADEFSLGGRTASFDKDAAATAPSGTGTTINTPSITPTGSGELLFACAAAEQTITAPASGATLGVWTGSGGAITVGNMAEYDLSASAATAVQFTQSPAGGWSVMAMAFILFTPDEDYWKGPAPRPVDPDITVWQ
jgi:hypothetical protein